MVHPSQVEAGNEIFTPDAAQIERAERIVAAYAAAGVKTEHEAITFAEAAEKARAGLAVLVR